MKFLKDLSTDRRQCFTHKCLPSSSVKTSLTCTEKGWLDCHASGENANAVKIIDFLNRVNTISKVMIKDITKQSWEMLCCWRWRETRVPAMGCLYVVLFEHILLKPRPPVSCCLFPKLCQLDTPSYLWFCVLLCCLVSPCPSKPHSINTNQSLVFSKAWLGAYQNAAMYNDGPTPVCPAPCWPHGVSLDWALGAALQHLQVCFTSLSSPAACCNS